MPKATVYKNYCMMFCENKVWMAVNAAGVEPKPKAVRVQSPPEDHLRLGILPLYSRHHPGTGLLINDIAHMRPGSRT
jgi:hypothetical protein